MEPTGIIIDSENNIYFRGFFYNPGLYSIDSNGQIRWIFNTIKSSFLFRNVGYGSSPVIGKHHTIYFTHEEYLYAINFDGTLKWSTKLYGTINSTPAMKVQITIAKFSFLNDSKAKKKPIPPKKAVVPDINWIELIIKLL